MASSSKYSTALLTNRLSPRLSDGFALITFATNSTLNTFLKWTRAEVQENWSIKCTLLTIAQGKRSFLEIYVELCNINKFFRLKVYKIYFLTISFWLECDIINKIKVTYQGNLLVNEVHFTDNSAMILSQKLYSWVKYAGLTENFAVRRGSKEQKTG